MTLTLLLDLDDTLLGNNMDSFIPAYLAALAKHLHQMQPPDLLIEKLLSATRLMMENRSPEQTLKQVFDASFYPALGINEVSARSDIESFYEQVFPSLKNVTQLRTEAIHLVEQASSRGYKLVVATNPLFPRTAILQRIAWAGLKPENFQLISSYEHFHFAKPDPAYFAEILGLLGWPEGPIVMVGNHPRDDIAAAEKFGLATFLVNEENRNLNDARTACGGLTDVLPWIDQHTPEELLPDYHHPQGILAVLRSTPAVLDQLTWCIPENAWTRKPANENWAPVEILCHLRDADQEVNLGRVEAVLTRKNPFLPGIDTDVWADEKSYISQNGAQAWQDFTQARLQLLKFLMPLQAEGWLLPARHAIFGPTNLTELAFFIAGHDQLHIRQMIAALEMVNC